MTGTGDVNLKIKEIEMSHLEERFFNFVKKLGRFNKRSMFGGVGLFNEDAMFSLVTDGRLYVRGGGDVDARFEELGCERFKHVKKTTIATVNYFDVTELFEKKSASLLSIVQEAMENSRLEREFKKSKENRRLRDLPNMQLTLERMVKKAGVPDVDSFLEIGAVDVFKKVNHTYGGDVDVKLLWKFAGAESGVHWTLLQEPAKQALLQQV
ncbi:DNA transformation protein TfoX [Aliivibrio fischeri]|uniref:DNA transformation protein TfoX n=1 Tax=Aliivibrio fischeri TaxID=668 RepID=UPI001F25DDBD|nr:DNA transformation protein TfoX [Aliivibrio fischeri]MCE7564608.1 DNA transformation protein TfoX [Aliivibrio fischeri]